MGFTPTGKETLGHLPWEGGGSGISPQDHLGPRHFVTEERQFRAQPLGKLPRICLSSPSPLLPCQSVSLTFLSFLSHVWACTDTCTHTHLPAYTNRNGSREMGSFIFAATSPAQLVSCSWWPDTGARKAKTSHTQLLSAMPRAFPPRGR